MSSTIPVDVIWKTFTPDRRAYKPSAPTFEVNQTVRVEVPIKDNFANADKILVSQLDTNSVAVQPILSVQGVKYIIDQFESVMKDLEITLSDDEKWEEDEPIKKTATELPWEETATITTELTESPEIDNLEWES